MPGKKLISLFAAAAVLLLAVPAFAEQTPDTYKEAVEPICKTNTEANEKILKGVKQLVKEGKLDAAAKKVFAAATDESDRLRYPAGADSEMFAGLRWTNSEDEYLRRMRAIFAPKLKV